nr:uncharacterized protein LOC118049859 [Populus alba]
MEFHGGDKVEVCSEEEGFLGSYDAATTAKNLVEEEDMSKHLIETHHKPSAKTHRWSTLLNSLNLRTHPTPKPLTHALKPSPPLLLIFFFFKPNPFLVDGATIFKKTPLMVLFFNLFDRRRMILYFRMYIKQAVIKGFRSYREKNCYRS